MAKIKMIYYVDNDGELGKEELRVRSKEEGVQKANLRMKTTDKICGFYFLVNNKVDGMYLYGYKRSASAAVQHPNFKCFDDGIYMGKYPEVVLLQTGHLIECRPDTHIIMKDNKRAGF